MGGRAHRHRIEARAGQIAHRAGVKRPEATRVSGPGQKACASRSARSSNAPMRRAGGEVGHMGDQRIEARPALGLVDGGHGARVGRVGGQAIDGLGGQDDQPAGAQGRDGGCDPRLRPGAL